MAEQRRLVRKSEFAELQGWSRPYVTQLGHEGRLVLSADGSLVDVDATRARLRESADPARESTRRRHMLARAGLRVPSRPDPEVGPPGLGAAADPGYWSNKTRREAALAELAELELATRRGDMIPRGEAESTGYDLGRALRDTLLGLPTRLAPRFATLTDAADIKQQLHDVFSQVFVDFDHTTADRLARLTSTGR